MSSESKKESDAKQESSGLLPKLLKSMRRSLDKDKANAFFDSLVTNRRIHNVSADLFKNGRYRNAISDAFIELETMVKEKAGYPHGRRGELGGASLVRHVFNLNRPLLKWSELEYQYQRDELEGYQNLFAGAFLGIRNPKAHTIFEQTPRRALELMVFINLLAEILDICEVVEYDDDDSDSSTAEHARTQKKQRIDIASEIARARKEEKDESKNEMKKSLFTDINHNDKLLIKGFEDRTKYQHRAFWHELRTTGFESVVSSVRYQLLSPDAQDELSEYYRKIQRMNTLVKKLDGEERALKIQRISAEQTPLLNDLRNISSSLKTILNAE